MDFKEIQGFLAKQTIRFEQEELFKMQKSCLSLYDMLWNNVYLNQNPANEFSKLDLKDRLGKFLQKYLKDYNTCNKYVHPGSPKFNNERFWFLSTFSLFVKLHQEGYYFDCARRAWQGNALSGFGEVVHDIRREFKSCSYSDIKQAFNLLSNFVRNLKDGDRSYYRFIDYDNHQFGTHERLFSWVKLPASKFECSAPLNFEIFPEDLSWKFPDEIGVEDSKVKKSHKGFIQ
jgi:hypothetical protein